MGGEEPRSLGHHLSLSIDSKTPADPMKTQSKPSPPNPLSLKIRNEAETSDSLKGPDFQGEGELDFHLVGLDKSIVNAIAPSPKRLEQASNRGGQILE